MSLRTETDKAIKNLREIRKAVLGRGGEISATAGLKDLPDAIYNIPADTSLAFQEDSSSTYRNVVPAKAEEYALVKKIGGMSYKCNNYIHFPYTEGNVGEVKTVQGITYTVLEGGGLHVKGATGAGIYASFTLNNADNAPRFVHGQTYIISGVPKGIGCVCTYYNAEGTMKYWGSGATLVWDSSYTFRNIYVQVEPNQNVDLDIYPMLNEGTTALPYEPYFEGLRETKVNALKSEGANLISSISESLSRNNVDIINNGDGTITINGTPSANTEFYIMRKGFEAGTYSYGIGNNTAPGLVSHIQYTDKKGIWIKNVADAQPNIPTKFTVTDDDSQLYDVRFNIFLLEGKTLDNVVISPMLNYGTEAAPYKPYQADALDAFVVPKEIQDRADWGIGSTVEHFNHIDLVRKKYIPKSRKIVYDGSADERWGIAQYNNLAVYTPLDTLYEAYPLATGFKSYLAISNQADGTIGVAIEGYDVGISGLFFGVKGIASTTDEWRAYLAGHPITVVMSYKNPTEEDISHLLTDSKFLKTEGGGSIVAHNEHKYDAPTTIKYTVKVGS